MSSFEILFWCFIIVIFYSYAGYALLLFVTIKLKKLFGKKQTKVKISDKDLPEVTMFVAAYNEKDFIDAKQKDFYNLNYPKDKIHYLWLTDGSDDGSPELLKKYEDVELRHEPERRGKISAMNRGMKFVKTPIVIFSDCNTGLGKESVRKIVELLANPKVGCVAGEKRIYSSDKDTASGAGEGLYWRYESQLKRWEAELSSVVGAAGELFAIRTELFKEVEADTLLDDFIISLRIAMDGYSIQYNPEAYAIESASLNVKEELKRKIRISAGAIQSIIRLRALLNPFKYGWLSIQYFSHKFLRWTFVPLFLLLVFPLNLYLIFDNNTLLSTDTYIILFSLQLFFYFLSLLGYLFSDKKIRFKFIFIPYYFFIMNLSVYLGLLRFLKGKQSVNWEKSKRS